MRRAGEAIDLSWDFGVNALDWLRAPSREAIRPTCVVFGDDTYLVRESIQAVRRAVLPDESQEAGVSRFPGGATPLASVLDEVRTLPFFSRTRLVIVDDADTFVTKYRKELESYAEKPHESGILLLQTKQWTSTTRLAKLVAKVGLAIDCSSPKEADLVPWLSQIAQARFDVQLGADQSRLLLELVGPEAGILVSEIEKLAVYAGESRRIERNDILKLVGAGRAETVWKTLDAALAGDGRVALEHLDNLIAAGEDSVGLLAAMSTSLLKVHHAGRLRAARLNVDEACRLAGIPPFAVEKTRKQHAHLGPSRVDQLPRNLVRADLDIKGNSTLDPRVVLETFLIRLALPRAD
jgi:DNA polymerase III subunit delta